MPRRARRQPRTQDAFGKRAQKEGYPARSVYKLQEIDRRVRLFRRGMRVLDLGACPGSWTLYAAERVGREGKVIGIDLNPARTALPPQAHYQTGDVMEVTADALGGPSSFEVVLSDMAPKTTGARDRDQYLSFELYMRALHIATEVLVPGGWFVAKLFQGPEFEEARAAARRVFEKVRLIKPEASRDESYEVFIVGMQFTGALPAGPGDGGDAHEAAEPT